MKHSLNDQLWLTPLGADVLRRLDARVKHLRETRVRLTPLGRSLVLPAKVQRDCVWRAMLMLRRARGAINFGLELAADGHHIAVHECFRQAVVALRAARGRLGVLFSEDWRHK